MNHPIFKQFSIKCVAVMLFLCAPAFFTFAAPEKEADNDSDITVLASTSWTKAFAEAAGAKNVKALAPSHMLHPAEYELKPSDFSTIKNADFFIYAGYEVMMETIQDRLNISEDKKIAIETRYDRKTLTASIQKIAEKLGTTEHADKTIKNLKDIYSKAESAMKQASLNGKSAFVHQFQVPLAKELGLKVLGVFGPAPLEAAQIAKFNKTSGAESAALIIDNEHNPVATPLKEIFPQAEYALLVNFPGMHDTVTLADVLKYNIKQITQ